MRRLNRTDYLGFFATLYNPSSRRRHSYRYATNAKTPFVVSSETSKDNSKISFKFGSKVPKNWKGIMHKDEAAGDVM